MCGYDSDIQDLVSAIHEYYDDEKDNALNLLKTLTVKFNSKELELATMDYAAENGLCYECEYELETESWAESRPFGDTYAYENLSRKVCPLCGFESEGSDD